MNYGVPDAPVLTVGGSAMPKQSNGLVQGNRHNPIDEEETDEHE